MIRIGHGLGVCALLAAAACSSTSSNNPAGGKDGGGTGGKGSSEAGSTFKLQWALQDPNAVSADAGAPDAARPAPPPLAGVNVCVDQHPEIACATSAADGTFTLLGFSALTNYVLTFDKTGYLKASKSIQTASTDMQVATPMSMYRTDKLNLPPGVTQDPAKGSLLFFTIGPVPGNSNPNAFQGVSGASVSLSPKSGDGPLYIAKSGRSIDPTLTQTALGAGYYFNLAPGDYTLTFTDSALDCAAIKLGVSAWGIPVASTPNALQFTVLPGYLVTEMGVFCTQKSVIIGAGDGG